MTAPRLAARAEVVVPATPEAALPAVRGRDRLLGKPHTPYWNDAARGLYLRVEPGVGGRFVEVHDAETGSGFEIGRVTRGNPASASP
jgi:hypothetical protein